MTTFLGRAAQAVNSMFSFLFICIIIVILVISHIGFVDRTSVLVISVPGHDMLLANNLDSAG